MRLLLDTHIFLYSEVPAFIDWTERFTYPGG
jgi:hypothetical protein